MTTSQAERAGAFDEAVVAAGRPRPAYAVLARRLGWDPLRPPARVRRAIAARDFGDGTRLVPVPLVLADAEDRERIQRGVVQRARALQRFFADVVLQDAGLLRAGSRLSAELLDGILASEGTSLAELRDHWRRMPLDAIRFVYGPDLAREPSGGWVVLEDNAGCVSGCADSFLVSDAYARACGLDETSHRPDLAVAIERWLGGLGLRPGDAGVVALLSDAHGARWVDGRRFQEDLRRQALVQRLGVRIVDNASLERIAAESGRGLADLRAIVNIGVPSARTWPMLLDACFGRARVPMLNSPGTSVLGSKALLPFVAEMIGFYLGEDAILDAPPTVVLDGGRLPEDPEGWVVKAAAGCGGTEVFDLRACTPDELAAIERALAWPERASVAQRRVDVSLLSVPGDGKFSVELRALGYVLGWQDVFAGEQSLARLTPLDRDGGLHVAPVLTAPP